MGLRLGDPQPALLRSVPRVEHRRPTLTRGWAFLFVVFSPCVPLAMCRLGGAHGAPYNGGVMSL